MPWPDLLIYGESVAMCLIAVPVERGLVHSRFPPNRSAISSRGLPLAWVPRLVVLFLFLCTVSAFASPAPESWVPIRWTGGPLELAWRTRLKTLVTDAAVRDVLYRWYEPATLTLLDDSPANCLLVTWSAPADAAVVAEQQHLVKVYAAAVHKRGLAVLGLVYEGGDAAKIAADASRAALDGLVLEGEFSPRFIAELHKAAGSMLVIEIAKRAAPWRWTSAPIVAVAGVDPSGRNLSEMGIRGAPSSEPWIESNIWRVRWFAANSPSHPIWTSSQLENPTSTDYARAVADAAAAGGRWIISLDDALRTKLLAGDPSALETWHRISRYLKFAESHRFWRTLAPFGNVGIVLDPKNVQQDLAGEYLNLLARRQVPHRLLTRSELSAAAVANYRALVAIELDPPSPTERKVLQDFAETGGVVIAAASWGDAPKTEPFSEFPLGKGRVIVYRDPDPAEVARDLKELLSDDELGLVPFNVPSVITFASGGGPGKSLLVQLLNYFDHPVEAITLRVTGTFRTARIETPESAPMDLQMHEADGTMEITIPKLLLWGVVSLE